MNGNKGWTIEYLVHKFKYLSIMINTHHKIVTNYLHKLVNCSNKIK